jgi:hypothetical protein
LFEEIKILIYRITKEFFLVFCRNEMITGMQEIDKMKSQMADINVPLEVFE